jgi:YVTN family beta-propeller protein
VTIDPKSHRVYVANVLGDDVTVIDGAKNAVIGASSAGVHPYGVAVDPASGLVFAANYGAPWVTAVSN